MSVLKFFGIIIALLSCNTLAARHNVLLDETLATQNNQQTMDILVSTQWLSEHLDDPDLIVLDCTFLVKLDENGVMFSESGKKTYDLEHIPNAGFADLVGELSDQDSEFEFWMPSPSEFAHSMAALGVGNDSRVVLYGRSDPIAAARVWWMLQWIGVDNVAILDGGLSAWKKEGRETSSKAVSRPVKQLSINLRPKLIVNHSEVHAAITNDEVELMDALPGAHYRGEFSLYQRAGHISGAKNMSSMNLIDGNYYRSYDELDLMFDDERNKPVITYCGGGVAAASLAFTMRRLGFNDVSVYMGSLQEWSADPTNPMTIDAK